ncbi:MAG TPA: exodeoxyribonuclease VII large subunit [Mycobacteriales bacterium]|nr:exodeoxyribonuclease VII large subunit [Mycobacteriales bacterium]
MAQPSTAETPLPVRTVARHIADWVHRLGRVWVEGQVTQLSRSPGTVFLTLRDPIANVSLSVTCARGVAEAVVPPLTEGARVVVHAKPDFYLSRGTLSLQAYEIRPVGVGELLARIERLKAVLRAEGLFAPERKRALPFLPGVVGLVTGRASAAERDVLENARRRWPAVVFDVRGVAVQGHLAVEQVVGALRSLDADRRVEVIVLARGGGSVEDLLPWSDETLCRAVAACRTPVVSAIGHEPDSPLVDLVADVRCSTPTDAGKRVVPDVAEELTRVHGLRDRARRHAVGLVQRERAALLAARSRPVLADPRVLVATREGEVLALRERVRRCTGAALDAAQRDLTHTLARVVALSPQATLERGYAVVQDASGAVVRDPAQVGAGDRLRIRVAAGELGATAT